MPFIGRGALALARGGHRSNAGSISTFTPGSGGGGMMVSAEIDTTGLDNLAHLSEPMAEQVLRYAAIRGAARARINIRDVGAIDTSFMVNTTRARRLGQFLWSIGTAALYGVFIEYGTVRMGARPWLTPAYNEAVGLFNSLLRTALRALPGGTIDVPSSGDA